MSSYSKFLVTSRHIRCCSQFRVTSRDIESYGFLLEHHAELNAIDSFLSKREAVIKYSSHFLLSHHVTLNPHSFLLWHHAILSTDYLIPTDLFLFLCNCRMCTKSMYQMTKAKNVLLWWRKFVRFQNWLYSEILPSFTACDPDWLSNEFHEAQLAL